MSNYHDFLSNINIPSSTSEASKMPTELPNDSSCTSPPYLPPKAPNPNTYHFTPLPESTTLPSYSDLSFVVFASSRRRHSDLSALPRRQIEIHSSSSPRMGGNHASDSIDTSLTMDNSSLFDDSNFSSYTFPSSIHSTPPIGRRIRTSGKMVGLGIDGLFQNDTTGIFPERSENHDGVDDIPANIFTYRSFQNYSDECTTPGSDIDVFGCVSMNTSGGASISSNPTKAVSCTSISNQPENVLVEHI